MGVITRKIRYQCFVMFCSCPLFKERKNNEIIREDVWKISGLVEWLLFGQWNGSILWGFIYHVCQKLAKLGTYHTQMLHGTGIFTYIPPKFMLNVGKKFQSHGACGIHENSGKIQGFWKEH